MMRLFFVWNATAAVRKMLQAHAGISIGAELMQYCAKSKIRAHLQCEIVPERFFASDT